LPIYDGDVAVMGGGGGGFEFGEDLAGGVAGALLFGCGGRGSAAEEAGDFVQRALRGGEADALEALSRAATWWATRLRRGRFRSRCRDESRHGRHGPRGHPLRHKGFEALQGEGEVTAALGGHEGVDFVEDDGLDGAQRFAGVGGEQEVNGFRGGDQDIGGGGGGKGGGTRR